MLYSGVGAVIVFILLVGIYETFFTTPPTCFDNTQDGEETGVDCGGTQCSLICADVAHPPIVLWARSFETSPTSFNAVAYIQNNNQGAGALKVPYSFQLFDKNNILIVERDGVVDLPPVGSVPIIESNLSAGTRTVARTLFSFTDDPPAVWNKISDKAYPKLRVSPTAGIANADYSKLSTTLINDTASDVKTVSVVAILYNASGTAIATSKSLVARIAAHSQQPIVFTWPEGVAGVVRAEIIPLPSF